MTFRAVVAVPSHPFKSIALFVAVVVMVLGNLEVPLIPSFLNAITLDQAWDVFAPNPVGVEVQLEATLRFVDGTEKLWHPPRANPIVAPLSYHWEMWSRAVISGFGPVALACSKWLVATYATERPIKEVLLRRRWLELQPPGVSNGPKWRESDFFIYQVPK